MQKSPQPPPPVGASGQLLARPRTPGWPSIPSIPGLPFLAIAGHRHPAPRCPACHSLCPLRRAHTARLQTLVCPGELAPEAPGGAPYPGGPECPGPEPGSVPIPQCLPPAAGLCATVGARGSPSGVPGNPGPRGPGSLGPLDWQRPGTPCPPPAQRACSCFLGWEGKPRAGSQRNCGIPWDPGGPGWPLRLSGKQ